MNRAKYLAVLAIPLFALAVNAGDTPATKTAAQLEKEKAMANPYSNDFGPDKIDDEVKDYPVAQKEGYKLLLTRCSQCHSAARPLNSRFIEPAAGSDLKGDARDAKQKAAVTAMQKEHPEWFKDKSVNQIEAGIWNRYVKRMLNKPGCGKSQGGQMTDDDAKKIYQFLVYDGEKRKLGANAGKWAEHRKKLIGELKEKKADRYKELSEQNDL